MYVIKYKANKGVVVVVVVLLLSPVRATLFFFCKNIFYKNIEVEILRIF